MVHFDGHEMAFLGTYSGLYSIVRGVYGKHWIKQFIHREPVLAMSVGLFTIGITLPIIVVPIRRRLGYPTNQYDAFFPGTVFPELEE